MAQIVHEVFQNVEAAGFMTKATHDLITASERMREVSKSMSEAPRVMRKAAEAMEKAAKEVGQKSGETEVRMRRERPVE
jgi:hypothetical protein